MTKLDPVVSIGIRAETDGTYTAHLTVSGLASFSLAQTAAEHLEKLFCGDELSANDAAIDALKDKP